MVIPAINPFSAISSSINATIKILEVTYQLKAVDQQTEDLLATTRHVDPMVQEARRLRRLNAGLLNTSERTMIDTVISDTEDALRAVATLVEPCRVDKDTKKSIRFGHRVMWVFRDNPSVRDKHQKLQICYQSLAVVFNCLYSKNTLVTTPSPEERSDEQPPPYDPQSEELLNWQNLRKGRKRLGEREPLTEENLGLPNGSPSAILVAGPSSPCLLALPLDDDGATSSLSALTELWSELPAMPASDVQTTSFPNNAFPLPPNTSRSESTSPSLHLGAFPYDENQNPLPGIHANTRNDYLGPMHELPEIDDSAHLATTIATYDFNDAEKDGLQVDRAHLAHVSSSTWDKAIHSSAFAPDMASSTTPSVFSLPPPDAAIPVSSKLSAEIELGLRWLGASSSNGYELQESAEVSGAERHLRGASIHSDTGPRTTDQQDSLAAIASAEDAMTRDNRDMSVEKGLVKRGGQSWLAYHASMNDMGHKLDWHG